MRFKIGDRVVKKKRDTGNIPEGEGGEILDIDKRGNIKVSFSGAINGYYYCNPDKFELEEIFNSPLIKVLEE